MGCWSDWGKRFGGSLGEWGLKGFVVFRMLQAGQ